MPDMLNSMSLQSLILCACLVEDLAGERVRILTQETQNGEPAKNARTHVQTR